MNSFFKNKSSKKTTRYESNSLTLCKLYQKYITEQYRNEILNSNVKK